VSVGCTAVNSDLRRTIKSREEKTMGLIDIANYYGIFKEMKELIGQVTDKELQQKLNENFQWLMKHSDCYKTDQTTVKIL